MKLSKCLRHAFRMVIHSRLRSWLTIIGIIIGVASVIAIVSFSNGLEASMEEEMDSLGADVLTLTSGYTKAQSFGPGRKMGGDSSSIADDPITNKELQALKLIPEIDELNTVISGNADVYYLGEEASITVQGSDPKVFTNFINDELDKGRYLESSDSNVIVVGSKVVDMFDKPLDINKQIVIEGKSFRVIGILEEGTGSTIYMPINTAYEILEDKTKNEFDKIQIILKEDTDLDFAIGKIESKINMVRHVDEKTKDFTVSSNQQFNEMRSEMMSTLTMFLTSIAAISLIVGAVGIANTMFTAVLEKTKEIGIMKAIGAKNKDIMLIFILNSMIIGLIGGIVGLIFGIGIAEVMSIMLGVEPVVTIGVVMLAVIVSISTGLISGIIPAYQASKLSPVDALRYE